MVFKDYEDFSHTVGSTVGHMVNSHIQKDFIANSGLSTTAINALKLGDAILSNASCRYEQQNLMSEFNPDNVHTSAIYCSNLTGLQAIPTFSKIQEIEKQLLISRLEKTPQQLYNVNNQKFMDMPFLDQITHIENYVSYVGLGVAANVYDAVHLVTDSIGNGIGNITTSVLNFGGNLFSQKDEENPIYFPIQEFIDQKFSFPKSYSDIPTYEQPNFLNFQGFAGDIHIPINIEEPKIDLIEKDKECYPPFIWKFSSSDKSRKFTIGFVMISTGYIIPVFEGNPLALLDDSRTVNGSGYGNEIVSEAGIYSWELVYKAKINDKFYGINIEQRTKNQKNGMNQVEQEYKKQVKVKFNQITGLSPDILQKYLDNQVADNVCDLRIQLPKQPPKEVKFGEINGIGEKDGKLQIIYVDEFTIHGFNGAYIQESLIYGGEGTNTVSADNDFLDIHVERKSTNGKDATENRKKIVQDYYDQAKVRYYQVTGLPHESVDPDRAKPTTRYEKEVEAKLYDRLIDEWIETKELNDEQKNIYNSIIRVNNGNTFWERHQHEDVVTFVKNYYQYLTTGKDNLQQLVEVSEEQSKKFFQDLKKVNPEKNADLTRYEVLQKKMAYNKNGEYSRKQIIYDVNNRLLQNDISMGNLVNTLSTSGNSVGAYSLAYIDKEFMHLKNHGFVDYGLMKINQFGSFASQGYVNSAITSHITSSIGLMEATEKWSDEFLSDWVAPNVYGCSSLAVSSLMCFKNDKFKHMNTGERFQMITGNALQSNAYPMGNYLWDIAKTKKIGATAKTIGMAMSKTLENYGLQYLTGLGGLLPSIGLLLINRGINWALFKDKVNYDLAEINKQLKIKNIIDNQKICDNFCKTSASELEKLIVMRKTIM